MMIELSLSIGLQNEEKKASAEGEKTMQYCSAMMYL
jgi:hypothetical protein